MSFGGSAADMLYKMKYNKSLRENNRGNYNRYRDAIQTYKKSRMMIKYEDISKEKLEIIKQDVIREVKKRNQIAIVLTVFFTTVFALLIIWGLYLLINSETVFFRTF